jgi:hypothetical protein
MRGTQFGETYDELVTRREVFERWFPLREARAFGISGRACPFLQLNLSRALFLSLTPL